MVSLVLLDKRTKSHCILDLHAKLFTPVHPANQTEFVPEQRQDPECRSDVHEQWILRPAKSKLNRAAGGSDKGNKDVACDYSPFGVFPAPASRVQRSVAAFKAVS